MREVIRKKIEILRRNPANLGLALMVTFGFCFAIVIWPLDIPDEPNHFMRAYQIAEGNWFSSSTSNTESCQGEHDLITRQEQNSTRGISTPKSIIDFTRLQSENYSRVDQFSVSLDEGVRDEACFRQTNANNPIGYLPQALVIWILKIFDAPPILMLYAARVAILLTWSFLVFFAIKIIPVRKWAFVGIALVPLAIQQSISIGADVLSIAPAALLMALVVRSRFEDRSKSYKKDLTIIAVLLIAAVLSKPVMILLAIPVLTYRLPARLDVKKYLGLTKAWIIRIIIGLTPLIFYGLWSVIASINKVSVSDIFVLAADKSEYGIFHLIPQFIGQASEFLMSGLSAQQFGSLLWFTHTVPDLWGYLGIVCLFVYIFVGYEKKRPAASEKKVQTERNTFLYYVTAIGLVAANIFTLFIIWTPIGSMSIEGVQLRYFLSAFLVAAAVYGKRYIVTSEKWFMGFVLIMSALFFIVSILTLRGYL